MKSNGNDELAPKRIEKTTEALWRVLWAIVYLIFIPTIVAVIFYFIFSFAVAFFIGDENNVFVISLALSAIMFLVSILIYYRPFDKYRKKSIFQNKINNPRARIHILFLITLVSLIYTPIFLLFVPERDVQEQLTLLPLLTFVLAYNSVYLYYFSQPIDFFSISESKFKHFNQLKDTIKQPYNLIILVNYVVLIAFLSITFEMKITLGDIVLNISWLFAIIANIVFYFIALTTTKPHIKKIEESIKNNENFLEDLVLYKQAFVKSIVRLDFFILILIPFGIISVFYQLIENYAIINAIFITLILVIFNFKLDIYIKSYFFRQLNRINPDRYATRDVGVKWNFFLTISFIILIPSYIFYYSYVLIPEVFYFNLLALLIIYLITRAEEKHDYLPKEYAKHLHLIITIFLSAIISFQIVPIVEIFVNFVIFFIILYFSLELFVKFGYYSRKNLLLVQNVLAIASFYCIAYLFFRDIAFGPSPIDSINTFMVHYILPGLIGSLFSLFLLYFRQFYKNSWKTLRTGVICNILVIIGLSFYLLNITPNVTNLIVSVIGFSILYIVLTGFNYLIHIFSKQNLASNVYSTIWVLDLSIFSAMLFNTLTNAINLLTIVPDFLVLSALILFTLWFGKKIGKVSERNYFKLFNVNGFLLILEIFILSSQFLIEEVFPHQVEYKVLAYFISTCITALIVNVGAPSKSASIKKAKNYLNIFTVMFGWFLMEMFYFLLNYQNLNDLYGLIIASSLISTIPIGFLVFVKILDKKRLLGYLFLVINVICLTFFSFVIHFILENEIDLFFGISFVLLGLVISYIGIGKVGVKLGYISNDFYLKFVKTMYYPIGIILFLVFFSFSLELTGDLFLSFLIAISLLSVLTNFANLIFKTIAKINFRITLITLFYAVSYASFLLVQSLILIPYSTLYEWYVYLYFSIILIQLMFYIPFAYLTAKKTNIKVSFFKYSYYSLYSMILLVFLLISSFFFYLFYSQLIGVYVLALIADIIYITIILYNHIKRGLAKHYLPVIHLSKKAAIVLYSALFSEFYAFLLTMILLLFQPPWQLWELFLSSYLAFVIISLVILVLANKLILFSIEFSHRINIISLLFTSILAAYFSQIFVSTLFVNMYLLWDIVILTFLVFSLVPLYYTINRNIFQRFINKKSVYVDGILISLSVIILPVFLAIEFSLITTFLLYIVISMIFLSYCFLKYVEHVFDELSIKQGQQIALKTIQLICWNLLSVFVSYTVFTTFTPGIINEMFYLVLCASSIAFFIINLNSLPIIEDIKQRVFENEELKIDYYKIYKIYEFYKNVSFFAFIFSISGLISTLLHPFIYLLGALIPLFFLTPGIIQFELFFLFSLLLLIITQKIEIEYQKTRTWIMLLSWLIIKSTVCGYIYSYFIETPILSWSISILIFSVFSPITLHFIKKIRLVFGSTSKIVNSILVVSFYGSLITLYLVYFWTLRMLPFFSGNLLLFWFLFISNSIIYFDYVIMRLRNIFEGEFEFNLLKLYFKSSLVLCLFIFFNFYLNLVLWFISAIILLRRRNSSVVIKFLIYILFSLSLYIYLFVDFSFLFPLEWREISIMLTVSLISVFMISIFSNYRKVNDLEKFSIYLLLSFLSFVSFSFIPEFSIFPGLFYNGSFSLLIFLALTGNYYYQKKDSRYKLFIRPCAVLAVFDLTSFLFYGLLFNFPPFSPNYQQILSFTSTFSLTGLTFVSLYNQSPQRFRRLSFFIVLPLLTLSIPTFIYFFIFASFPLLRSSVIPLTISLNVGILFFYIAIGLYQWKFSRAIWKTGFWAWILLPIVNYAIIDQSFAALSLRSLDLFGFNIPASTLLAITICIIISFPFWYSWIKAHFSTILFGTWIISLGLLYWFSQNLFLGNPLLINSSFLIFAFILLMPLVYKLKIWRVLMAFWILFTIIIISFINFFFSDLGTMVISIDISVSGLSIIFLSYFPNMKNRRNLSLLVAYFVLMTGISVMIYQIILDIVFQGLDPLGALYLTMIIISASSFSSRILKVNKILMNFLISWTLVISFALMTFHICNIFLPYNIGGALYISLTIGGLTFFIFNRYKMLWGPYENFMPVSSMIAFIAIALGTSLSISSILLNIISINPWFLIVAVFLFTNIIFLSFKIKNYGFILSYLLPIPISSLILFFLLFFEPLNNVVILTTIGILTYCVVNQLLKVNVKFKALLRLILYLDSFALSLLLLPFPDLSLNFFISMSILFILTTFDSLLSKKRKYWYIVLVNLISYISSTIFLFWYLNVIFLAQFEYMIWLNSFVFILLQKYTVYAFYTILKSLNKYDPEKLVRYRLILNYSLSNALYVLISLYGSLSLGSAINEYFSLIGIASFSLGLMIFCFFYFILNSIFNRKFKGKVRGGIRSGLFVAFQVSLFGLWAFSLGLNNFSFLMLIIIIETLLLYYTFSLFSPLISKESEKVVFNYVPFLTFLLYVEISILSFSLINSYTTLDLFYSSFYSLLIFFILTAIELGIVKKVNIKLTKLSHFVSYTITSVLVFIFAPSFLLGHVDYIIFNLIIILFLSMQFYTVRALFSFLSHYNWFNNIKALRVKQMINNILINSIFILLSLFGSLLISTLNVPFSNIFFISLLFSFFMFFLNGTINRTIDRSLRVKYLLVPSFIAMQIFSLLLMVEMLQIDVNLFIFWLSLIALIETLMSIYPLYIMRKYTKNEARRVFISNSFKGIEFCLYLEITILTFGIFYYNLREPFQSLLYSQLILFGLSVLEIFVFKSLKEKFGYIIHLISYLILSGSLVYIVFLFRLSEFLYLLIILMQFYSNYAYFRMKRDLNPENADTNQKWAVRRQRIIGTAFYSVLLFLVSRYLLFFTTFDIFISLFLISLLLHVITLFDRAILIFLGRLSMPLIVISLIIINIISIPVFLTWIFTTGLTYRLIPLVIIIVEIELFYLAKLTNKWKAFKNPFISVLYFNLSSWPIYFIDLSFASLLINFNLIMLSMFLFFIIVKIDRAINALSVKMSKPISSIALLILGFGIPVDLFILLQSYNLDIILNIAISALVGTMELGIVKRPYKRKRGISFFYTLTLLVEVLIITQQINIVSLGYSVLVIGTLIYLFMFMLEELKEFFSHIVDYVSRGWNAIKSFINSILTGIYTFLKRNYTTLKILFAAIIGGLMGYVSNVLPIFGGTLGAYDYAPLFGLAVFGLIVGLFPGKKNEDLDSIFRTRMTRFSTVWFGVTIFIFMIIIPVVDPLIQVILTLSSFLILGLILAIYVWRIEKKQKISIKWRLYITVVLIILLIVWAILLIIVYLRG